MKAFINSTGSRIGGLLLLLALSSFGLWPGSDSFEVYINNKLVLEQYVYNRKATPPLLLDEAGTEQIDVFYSHCGITGTSRKITLKDEQNKILKEWRFPDVDAHVKNAMSCNAKDIAAFKKGHQSLNLFYSAKEIQKEIMLAPIQWSDKTARGN